MLPSFRAEEKIIFTWLKASENILFFVTRNGIFRARTNNSGDSSKVESVLKMKHLVLSAWFSNSSSGQLSLLSRESITLVDLRSLRPVREYQSRFNEDAWICEVPGSWVIPITGQQILGHVHVVHQSGALWIVDIKSKKQWNKKVSSLSRGQFLAQFISKMIPSLVISSFSQLTALVPQSLQCKFLQSSIMDIQWGSKSVFILTIKKELWKVSRDPDLKLRFLLSNCSSTCLTEDLLTVLTTDGAVYQLTTDDCHGLKSQTSTMALEKGDNIQNKLEAHAKYLETVGDIADTLDSKISQVQHYNQLSKTSLDDIEKMLAFSVAVDVERKILYCTLKATSSRLSLLGKFWILQGRILGRKCDDKTITLTAALPDVLSETSEPLHMKVVIPEDYKTIPSQVEAFLVFNVAMVKSVDPKLFPPIRLKSHDFDLLDLLDIRTEINSLKVKGINEEELFKNSISLSCPYLPKESVTIPYENIRGCVKLENILNQSIQKTTVVSFQCSELRIKGEISKKTQLLTLVLESNNKDLLQGIKRKILNL